MGVEEIFLLANLTWLRQPLIFNPDYTSFIIDLYGYNKHFVNSSCEMNCFKGVVNFLLSNNITRVFIPPFPVPTEDDSAYLIRNVVNSFLTEGAYFNKNGNYKIQLNPGLGFVQPRSEQVISNSISANIIFPETVETLVQFPVTKYFGVEKLSSGQSILEGLNKKMLNETVTSLQNSEIGLGFVIKLDECSGIGNEFLSAVKFAEYFKLNDLLVDGIVRNKTGFDVIFPEFKAKAILCKNNLIRFNLTVNNSFIMGWPRPEGINETLEFVRYWEGVGEWAEEEKTRVIFDNALDTGSEVGGWWKPLENDVLVGNFKVETQKEVLYKLIVEAKKRGAKPNRLRLKIAVAVIIAGGLLIGIFMIGYNLRARSKVRLLSSKEIKEFFEGVSDSDYCEINEMDRYEIAKESFSVSKEVLGRGIFGNVFRGRVTIESVWKDVAVKGGNEIKSKAILKGLMGEVMILTYLGKHENVVELVGVNTQEIKWGKLFLFLELCEASLEKYLRGILKDLGGNDEENAEEMEVDVSLIPSDLKRKLLIWSYQIANGMDYISSLNIVHLDLAARNILLGADGRVKISDFSQSQQLNKHQVYASLLINGNIQHWPWRWMAPECFVDFKFTTKSDVWAFGITLWEIFSFGEIPYGGESWSEGFITKLCNGMRLGAPFCNRDDIFEVIKCCWNEEPNNRLEFKDLKLRLHEIVSSELIIKRSNYVCLETSV